ncbi:MAG: hypothetical protein IPM61_15645 [Chlorobi bacterium]|nr:hypothetical protein [Chlorobiota bacterium]MBX7216486.1 hypothetical protein [Candidatus Kapabacteria bacterium]
MKNNPEHLRFLPPCDLCGGFRSQALTIGGEQVHRCQNCGLVRVDSTHEQCLVPANRKQCAALERSLKSHLKKLPERNATILLVGASAARLADAFINKGNLTIHLLTELETPAPRGVIRHVLSIEQAAFIPDLFDVVVADVTAQPIPPSLLLQKARLWLKPGRSLLLVADNSASLLSAIWRRSWMGQRGASLTHLLTSHHLERYATRSGFAVRRLRTVALPEGIAQVIARGNKPSIAVRSIGHLLAGIARLASAGEVLLAELEKHGTAQIPLHKPAAERDQSPGLAHAMYAGMKRESMAESGVG